MPGKLVSVNVGRPRAFEHQGKTVESAIWKAPVPGRVRVRGVNIDGDDQADRKVHGGPDQAIYAYAREDVRYWEAELGRALEPGAFGENLTTEGLDVTGAVIGECWEIGTTVLEVSQPRGPCWKLAYKMGDPGFVKRFTRVGRPGAYLRIVREGALASGDDIRVIHHPEHGLTIGEAFRIYASDRKHLARLLDAPELSESWRSWAEAQQQGG